MDLDETQLIDSYAQANAISGQMCQFSRALMATHDPDDVLNLAVTLLEATDASGFLRLSSELGEKRSFFNGGLSRKFLSLLQCNDVPESKIYCDEHLLKIQTDSLLLLLDLSPLKPFQKDILVDHLAIFADTVQAWLVNRVQQKLQTEEREHNNCKQAVQLQETIGQLNNITLHLETSYQSLVQELICALTKNFPTMALEHDQEDLILTLIERECAKHKVAVSKQIDKNQSLISLLNETVEQLSLRPIYENEQVSNIQAVELF